jgi:hypothetical protein
MTDPSKASAPPEFRENGDCCAKQLRHLAELPSGSGGARAYFV